MVDNLPLIPEKGAACTDVRPVLRSVFQELDYLPPLTIQGPLQEKAQVKEDDGEHSLPSVGHWVDKYKSECTKISGHEDEIQNQYVKRLARKPAPNVFKLHEQCPKEEAPKWRFVRGLIGRKDLKPYVEENAGADGSLWVKNVLNVVSSCDVSSVQVNAKVMPTPAVQCLRCETSNFSFSVGAEAMCLAPSAIPTQTVAHTDYILCVPPRLDFINCTIGKLYARNIRLVNMTKFECRLSVLPPKHREFDVEISSPRGLIVTAGATVELILRFKPTDVRMLRDQITVRVSRGQACTIPITCYMQPPSLDILVPTVKAVLEQSALDTSSKNTEIAARSAELVELGARLLGDVHCSRILLYSAAKHAEFFILTEDAWVNWNLDCLTTSSSVIADSFVFWPAWWRGGGLVKACAWCCGDGVGTFVTELRVLSSTAIHRQLCLLADVLLFNPKHLLIEAHERDFDICSEADPGCEYYVNVGTALQHNSISTTVQLVNRSPILYHYYWDVRSWGMCFYWEETRESRGLNDDDEILCFGGKESKRMVNEDPEAYKWKTETNHVVVVMPEEQEIMPRNTKTLHVVVPDVGEQVGVQRCVLRLILKDIPKESFPADYKPLIINTREVESAPVPGLQGSTRVVCDVVCAKMEVWWKVVPLRFVLDPPVVPLHHSRRVKSVDIFVTACKLFGWEITKVSYVTPERVPRPPALQLSTARCLATCFTLPLPSLPNHYPDTDVLTLVAENKKWRADCVVTRQCEARHPVLQPVNVWLGVVPPKTKLRASFSIQNCTYQRICFWCDVFRWIGENKPRRSCIGKIPCTNCTDIACTCALLKPGCGALDHGDVAEICYNVNAPQRDGCVATLLRVRRCEPDLAVVHEGPTTEARAALVAYRVLAPRVAFKLQTCGGTGVDCGACQLDTGALEGVLGTSTLRPSKALVIGRRTCYRLHVKNISPLPTSVHFDKPIDGADLLKVTFTPNNISLAGYSTVVVTVVLTALRVCERHVFVCRAEVLRAHHPMYLVIDAAIIGLQISLQVPVGGGAMADDFVIMRRTQKTGSEERTEFFSSSHEEVFAKEDRQRNFGKEKMCRCKFSLQYVPPVKRPRRPRREGGEDYAPIEIVNDPTSLTRVCRCFLCKKPFFPEPPESISLEFINVPLRKVCERRLLLCNESVITAYWSASVRRWPRRHKRTLDPDQWAGDVCASGVALACDPPHGVLASGARAEILVQMYADCWGLYWDQILIQVDNVDPIVLDVWMEVIGPPLQFKIQPNYAHDELPVMRLSRKDSVRSLHVKNISRSELIVQAYVTKENKGEQDLLPFRLNILMYDILPETCACCTNYDPDVSKSSSTTSITCSNIMTGVELYLAPDHGPQDGSYYKVLPQECSIGADECMKWDIILNPTSPETTAPDAILMLRLMPQNNAGDHWYRTDPEPQLVRLRQVARTAVVKLSCEEIVVNICALDLPRRDFLRIRKRFRVLNVGNGNVNLKLQTLIPWCMVQNSETHYERSQIQTQTDMKRKCFAGCKKLSRDERRNEVIMLDLPPTSSTEVCVEVCIPTLEASPLNLAPTRSAVSYAPHRKETTPLHMFADNELLLTLPLTVIVEYPLIKIKPAMLDFGFVTEGDTKKTYISVSHSSPTATLRLAVQKDGCKEFAFWPSNLQVAPGCSERIYVQYTAVWRHGPAEGCIKMQQCLVTSKVHSAVVKWCSAAVPLRAAPSLDHKWHASLHDHTDDDHLLPRGVQHYLPDRAQ